MMARATGHPATMWGATIIGFGSCHFKYASGHEGDTCLLGFSPRKAALSLYFGGDGFEPHRASLDRLGKYKIGKGCLYVTRLGDIDLKVLKKMFEDEVAQRR